jgi:hypothetical protein
MKNCLNCGKENKYDYCSGECMRAKVENPNMVKCKTCEKYFYHPKLKDIRYGRIVFCSYECNTILNKLDTYYFKELTDEKLYTLGQMMIHFNVSDIDVLSIVSDEETIKDICNKIKIKRIRMVPTNLIGNGEYKRLYIEERKFIYNILGLGITKNMTDQEFPILKWEPIVEGMKSTGFFKKSETGNYLTLFSSKLALQISDFLGGKIYTKMERDEMDFDRIRFKYIVNF